MTDAERIRQLEKRIEALEREIVKMQRWVQPTLAIGKKLKDTYIPTVYEP